MQSIVPMCHGSLHTLDLTAINSYFGVAGRSEKQYVDPKQTQYWLDNTPWFQSFRLLDPGFVNLVYKIRWMDEVVDESICGCTMCLATPFAAASLFVCSCGPKLTM